VTLMSPYSSVFRQQIWGGVPVSLPAMSVFAFIAFWLSALVLTRRLQDRNAVGFLLAACTLPLLTSIVMGYLSFSQLGAACKLCIGIYVSSTLAFVGALMLWLRLGAPAADAPAPLSTRALPIAFAVGVAFVALPVVAYAAKAPNFERFLGACGTLPAAAGNSQALIPVGDQRGPIAAVEVLDPLCPACRGFERRFVASDFSSQVARKALLFPLDNTCNWMVDSAIHPGACAISEAVLCAGQRADDVLAWAFDQQETIVEAARKDPGAAARLATAQFPELRGCIGTPAVKARINRALRWAVANQLPVLTPQMYVGNVRLCDEDTDLGMEYATSRLIARAGGKP
jgi:protein-disulfide isomerase